MVEVSLKNGIDEESTGGGVNERDGLYASLSSSIFSIPPVALEEPESPGMPLDLVFTTSVAIVDRKETT
jgi:hypothetical protein